MNHTDPNFFDDIARKLSAMLPAGTTELSHDLQKNLRVLLQGAFARLDLVTREEFDAQSDVLRVTRAKLERLEAQVASLEEQFNIDSGVKPDGAPVSTSTDASTDASINPSASANDDKVDDEK